ncbi:hypothetical protein FACS189427_07990 [Planctomycetales bacterium]|nr:hypothetical protein FACS189427_07990 [Planctomycetales bacterium]
MKSFQFYKIESFPTLKVDTPVKNTIQKSFSGEDEDLVTSIELKSHLKDTTIDLIQIVSEVEYQENGYAFSEIGGERQRFTFTSFRHPVDFSAYLDMTRKILILPQPQKVCRSVFINLNTVERVAVLKMEVNFHKVSQICPEYFGAWFRGVSPRVNAAGLAGNQVQDDNYFKKLLKDGELSNATVPWKYDGAEHRLMISKSGALILQKEYRDNQTLEIAVVTDAFDNLLSKVWEPKKSRKQVREIGIPVEP